MRDYTTSLAQIKVKKHERLYNITHTNQNKETWETIQQHSNKDWSKGTWETIQHYTQTQIEVKEHERLYNITLRHRLK